MRDCAGDAQFDTINPDPMETSMHLIVVRPFGPWRVGDVVSEQSSIDKILGSEQADHVVRIHPPEEN